jgi:tetratricopeptide (TPR) repeat protein
MYAHHHHHVHVEYIILKWLIIISLASALALAFATQIGGAAEPVRSPTGADSWSAPTVGPIEVAPPAVPSEDVATQLWLLLDDQQSGRLDLVITPWQTIPLAPEAEVWRHVALAEAQIAMGDLDAAGASLETAGSIEPDNPLVEYYFGLLRLEQADRAMNWYEPSLYLASYDAGSPTDTGSPMDVVPNSKAMFRLAAMSHLERAIDLADLVWLDQPLVPETWPTEAALTPTVGDLLLALGANHFDAKAHNMLGYLHLEYGAADSAEQHMDAAAQSGAVIVFGYEDLARLYADQHRPLDAFRANAKAAANGEGIVAPVRGMIGNLRQAFGEL